MNKSTVARKWRKKHPETPTRKLARLIIISDDRIYFNGLEDVRDALRYIEGKKGERFRKSVEKTEYFVNEDRPMNPYSLPVSEEIPYEPFFIKGHKRVAIFSDIHVPYHNMEALTTAIKHCKKSKPDALLLNGDTIDCHNLSSYEKDPKKRDFKYELDTFKALIEVFEKELKCQIYFKIGNHEERYERFLFQKAGELVGIEEFEFENIIKARARGIKMIGDKRIMKLNGLNGIHGHEYKGGISAPVNIARGLYNKGKRSAFQGHNHQTSEHTEPDMDGKITTTWSIGCLSELHPKWMPLNKWNHGFAEVDLDDNGEDFEFRNYRIYKGKIL